MIDNELLPCPFCGSTDLGIEHNAQGWPHVICMECGAQGPCVNVYTGRAAENWNDRATRAAQAVPARWYCVNADGLATLCADERDAAGVAARANFEWPNKAPHHAVLLAAAPTPPAAPAMPAGCTTPDGCRAHGCHSACLPPAAAEARDAVDARVLLDEWAEAAGVRFVSRSHGQATTGTVSKDDLLQLVRAALAAHQKGN